MADTIDPANEGFLRLTNSEYQQTGFVYNNSIFPSTFGMDVEFEFFMHGGSGADGLTFFLFDAKTDLFRVGQFGGAMGYAHNCNGPGISNAYLGIGFDVLGNFSGPGECRSGERLGPGSIVVRGPGNGQAPEDYSQIAGVAYKVSDSFGTTSNIASFTVSAQPRPSLATNLSKTIDSRQSAGLELKPIPRSRESAITTLRL